MLFGSNDRLSIVQKGGRRTLPLSVDSHLAFHRFVASWKRTVTDTLSFSVSPALGWTKQSAQTQGAGTGGFANPQSADVTILTGEIRSEAILHIFLPILLFEAGLHMDVRRMMDDVAPILTRAPLADAAADAAPAVSPHAEMPEPVPVEASEEIPTEAARAAAAASRAAPHR